MAKVTSIIDVPVEPSIEELKVNNQSGANPNSGPLDSYFDFTWAKTRYDKIIKDWDYIQKDTERNRVLRYLKVDKDTLTSLALFKEDETYISVRLMDQNIRAEQPSRLAYITQPRRAVVLKPLYSPKVTGVENIEAVFTDCARYIAWEIPFIKVDDGASSHGWDFVEIVYDDSKPGFFAVEHVGHDNLLFDLESEDIHNQEVLLRRLRVTGSQLRQYVKEFGFTKAQVDEIVDAESKNESKTKDCLYTIYKCFFRFDGAIHVCWYGGDKATGYLKAPVGLYLGINDVSQPAPYPPLAETKFPFFDLDYFETDDPKIIDKKGRCFLDEPAQTAASALLSSIVNGNMRASNVYGAPAPSPTPQVDNTPPKQTSIKLQHGMMYDKPMTFFNTPYPPESAIQAMEMVTQYNKLDISRPDYAAKNRQDSRKTATEIQSSVNDAQQMASVTSTQQSVFMRKVYTKAFEIFQNRCLQGVIKLPPELVPLMKYTYDVKAAGDVDVIQRKEKMQLQQQSWPVVANTPIAMEFLKDFLTNAFPEEAPKYIASLVEDQQAKQLVTGLAMALKEAVTSPGGGLKPEYMEDAPQLQQLGMQVQQFLAPSQEGAEGQTTTTETATNAS